jgi:small nuclear ribonucleoprotein
MMEIERPLDVLNNLKGKKVKVLLKDRNKIEGTLVTFDIHINLVLEDIEDSKEEIMFVRGDEIVSVSPT